jgi:hypothetical protein
VPVGNSLSLAGDFEREQRSKTVLSLFFPGENFFMKRNPISFFIPLKDVAKYELLCLEIVDMIFKYTWIPNSNVPKSVLVVHKS